MWHASVAPLPGRLYVSPRLQALALEELNGVGSCELGEWIEDTGNAVHVRRRLSPGEAATVGPVLDVRGDPVEVERRLRPVRALLPAGYRE